MLHVTYTSQEMRCHVIRQAHPNAASYPLPPGPTSYHPLGYMNAMNVDPLRFFLQLAQQHGGITQFRAGFWPVYLVAGPTAIRHLLRDNPANYSKDTFTYRMVRSVTGNGLLTSDGEEWHQRRRLLQPIFARDRVAHYDSQIIESTRAMLERWQHHAAKGQPIDVGAEITRLTLNIACKTFFDVDFSEQTTGPVQDAVLTLSRAFTTRFRSKTAPLWGLLGFPTPDNPQLSQARSTLTAVVDQVIQRLEKVDTPAGHVLAQLTQTKDPDTGRQLSRQELQTEVLTLLLAGHDTTARALTWAFYLLAKHSDVQDHLASVIEAAGDTHVLAGAALGNLPYLHMVVEETLRLYPPVWAFSRRAEADDVVDGYRVPKGARILVSPYVAHRLPDIWPEPERFNPERFGEVAAAQRPEHAYLPFGAGPRQCIGRRFAMLELELVLALVMRQFAVRLGTSDSIYPEASTTLTPNRPIYLHLTQRP